MQTYEEKKQLLIKVSKEIPTRGEGFHIIRNDNFSFTVIFNAVTNTINQLRAGMESTKVDIFSEEQAEAIWRCFQEVDDFHLKDKYPEFNCFMVTSCYDNISLHLKDIEGRLKIIILRTEQQAGKKDPIYVCSYKCFEQAS
jgi:hypothetical protein